ncbi:MAG: glycosyltransferase [Nitrospirota bacterium]
MIPNGFDLERFQPNQAVRERIRKDLGIASSVVLIGHVARVDPMKDHDSFLAAAEIVVGHRSDVEYLLVGKDTETLTPKLMGMKLKNHAHILGLRKDIDQLLPALDVLCLSSAFGEGFPNVQGEAMACGVPCVVTDVGDAAVIVGETGLVAPPRNPESLCKAWCVALAWTAQERAARGRRARERIAAQFTVDRMVEMTLRELERVAGGSLPRTGR